MKTASDVYAMTNPALCSLIICSFLEGHEASSGRGAEFPLLFLPIPLVLSETSRNTFSKTNSRTGFFTWIQRNPEILIDLAARINRTATYSREGLLFGARYRMLAGDNEGGMRTAKKIVSSQLQSIHADLRSYFNIARRFGYWVAEVGSTRMILHSLGLTP
ncbi:three component ABC system middle component [Stigmatella aurantiaca]|uniref:Conserved uncharacterized protein n=1 Tax=Stigmatella aurantiaca (strain DW4/3-1) TaxID=378806 RepID=E3FWR3_STIAD|nr:three component ABC system middle component [Stigmatella aurantiaca]ADO69776.1 conserved uncharacterized protein [Stigmatella aurantiaca DW4/3-1]